MLFSRATIQNVGILPFHLHLQWQSHYDDCYNWQIWLQRLVALDCSQSVPPMGQCRANNLVYVLIVVVKRDHIDTSFLQIDN